jgi:hypothetical protein
MPQRFIDFDLALPRRQVQDAQVLPVRVVRRRRCQKVVGHAKTARRKQFGPVAVSRECARLTHQPVDHVPVVDAVFAASAQARHRLLLTLGVPHLDGGGVDTHVDPFADQPRRHRVDVPLDADRTARLHTHTHTAKRLQPPRRQRLQESAFDVMSLLSFGVTPFAHLTQKYFVRCLAREIGTATQQQCLLDRTLEAMMALLAIAVLVAGVDIDRLRLDLVVRHQRLITTREEPRPRSLNRQTHAITAMAFRHTAQCPHCVLKAFGKALETLRKANRHVLPVRVRQHEVIDHVPERLAVDGHAQVVHEREVRGAELARRMHLGEEDFLGRSTCRLPFFDASLQRPQLAVGKSAGMTALQLLKERLGFPARTGFEQFLDFRPDVRERIGPRPIRSRRCFGRTPRR